MIENILESYLTGLKSIIGYEKVKDNVWRITLPFVAGRTADFIEIYMLLQDNGYFKLTDDENTLNSLELSEEEIELKRNVLLYHISSNCNCCLGRENNEIFFLGHKGSFVKKLNMLVQCIITTNQLFNSDEDLRTLKNISTYDLAKELFR